MFLVLPTSLRILHQEAQYGDSVFNSVGPSLRVGYSYTSAYASGTSCTQERRSNSFQRTSIGSVPPPFEILFPSELTNLSKALNHAWEGMRAFQKTVFDQHSLFVR